MAQGSTQSAKSQLRLTPEAKRTLLAAAAAARRLVSGQVPRATKFSWKSRSTSAIAPCMVRYCIEDDFRWCQVMSSISYPDCYRPG
jgi:hypothetical protein